jgi:hypothetical protein
MGHSGGPEPIVSHAAMAAMAARRAAVAAQRAIGCKASRVRRFEMARDDEVRPRRRLLSVNPLAALSVLPMRLSIFERPASESHTGLAEANIPTSPTSAQAKGGKVVANALAARITSREDPQAPVRAPADHCAG